MPASVNEDAPVWLAALARDLPVDVRFIELMPLGAARDMQTVPNAEVLRALEDSVDHELLREALARLPARDREIIALRFGLGGLRALTQKEVADRLGISQSYISRLEKRILERLREDITHAWSA